MPAAVLHRREDRILIVLAVLHGAVLLARPGAAVLAAGVWWNANTIAHNFIHRPFFRSGVLNRTFSAILTVLLGFPQTLWRERHLAHHAGAAWRWRSSLRLIAELLLVAVLWALLARFAAGFFLRAYLPGYLAGLALCAAQGHWEHAGEQPVSHYGWLYNLLCFNDGYHAEHHAMPGIHWSQLPARQKNGAASSYPALLRWLDGAWLEALERVALRSSLLQGFVIRTHKRAIEKLLPHIAEARSITVVGGGLFPRTALILGSLAPQARITVIDSAAANIETARGILDADIEWRREQFEPGERIASDVAVIPLCFQGKRESVYTHPPARAVLVHDWIWHRRGTGAVVSWCLLKRINLIRS